MVGKKRGSFEHKKPGGCTLHKGERIRPVS